MLSRLTLGALLAFATAACVEQDADEGAPMAREGAAADKGGDLAACAISGEGDEPPFKDPESGFWDQGTWGACGYVALINANIIAGADDTGGKFEKAVRDCMHGRGFTDDMLRQGTGPTREQIISDCKEAAMAAQGTPVAIVNAPLCELSCEDRAKQMEVADAVLDAGGAATIALLSSGGGGHALTVTSMTPSASSEGGWDVELMDPNFPGYVLPLTLGPCGEVVAVPDDIDWISKDMSACRMAIEARV
ncbi:MAG: hypothetical protein R2939_22135 [Kofleriaceae bacterium]